MMLVALACIGVAPPPSLARAQASSAPVQADGEQESTENAGQGADKSGMSIGNNPGEGEIKVSLDQFGLGGMGASRPGDWTGFLVSLTDPGTTPRTVLVRILIEDLDGDITTQQRVVATNPGQKQQVWLYGRLPFDPSISAQRKFKIVVHETREVGASPDTPEESAYRVGRLLGSNVFQPGQGNIIDEGVGMIAVLGNRALGLRLYAQPANAAANANQQGAHAHEMTEIIQGLRPNDLPDRWMGLASYEAIVWGAGEISEMRQDRAAALKMWVERGGHLVIVMPTVGQTWTTALSNPLYDIMPAVIIERKENADLLPLRPMLTARLDGPYPTRGMLTVFKMNPSATPAEAMAILSYPAVASRSGVATYADVEGVPGDCVVVRRLVGAGAVTLIGIDLNQTALAQGELIDADIFWHRVLGRRGDLRPYQPDKNVTLSNERSAWYVDADIGPAIKFPGQAAVGLLAGLLVFAAYWLVVGPPAFYLMKRRGLHQHSWVAFLAGAMVFTGIAWGAANMLKPRRIDANHFTILDHVYGQNVQRARAWAGILIPRYGSARITIGDASGMAERSLASLAPWESPDEDNKAQGAFPDARGYVVDTTSPDAMEVPVRGTVKQIQADWAGSPAWKMIHPCQPDGSGIGAITLAQGWSPSSPKPLLTGTLVHELPTELRDVVVFVVRGQTEVNGAPSRFLTANVQFYQYNEAWKPGEPLALDALARSVQGTSANAVTYLGTLVPGSDNNDQTGTSLRRMGTLSARLHALTFLHQLPQLEEKANTFMQGRPVAAQRRMTHAMDLSRWFTQPCVIVLGVIEKQPSPVPMFVDAEEVKTNGVTFVRWVYPLPASPPTVLDAEAQKGRPKPKKEDEDTAAAPDPQPAPKQGRKRR